MMLAAGSRGDTLGIASRRGFLCPFYHIRASNEALSSLIRGWQKVVDSTLWERIEASTGAPQRCRVVRTPLLFKLDLSVPTAQTACAEFISGFRIPPR